MYVCMEFQTKFICKTFSWMDVIFQDESNEPSFIMIGYSDATVTMSNHILNVRTKASLATVTAIVPQLWRWFRNQTLFNTSNQWSKHRKIFINFFVMGHPNTAHNLQLELHACSANGEAFFKKKISANGEVTARNAARQLHACSALPTWAACHLY